MKTGVTINGDMVNLREVAGKVPNEVIGEAMEAPCKLIADRAKAYCPQGRTGNLRRSIGYKVSLNKLAKNIIIGIVGPRRRQPGRPTKYAHLVEFGHATSKEFRKESKTSARFIPARPFMRPAVEGSKGAIAEVLGSAIADSLSVKLMAARGKNKFRVKL